MRVRADHKGGMAQAAGLPFRRVMRTRLMRPVWLGSSPCSFRNHRLQIGWTCGLRGNGWEIDVLQDQPQVQYLTFHAKVAATDREILVFD